MRVLISEKLSEHKYKTPEGYLICTDAILARTGKQEYKKGEIFGDSEDSEKIIEVDRKPEEVFSEKTLASFENKPITVEHPDVDVNPANYKDYSVGFVRDVHRGKADGQDVILGTLVITDKETIEEIENGEHTNLSCGYDCDIDDVDNPQQKNIRGNHVALCEVPRAGITKIVDSVDEDKEKEEKFEDAKHEFDWYRGYINAHLQNYNIDSLINNVKSRRQSLHTNLAGNDGNMYFVTIDGSLKSNLEEGTNMWLDVVQEQPDGKQQRIISERFNSWNECRRLFNAFKSKVKDSLIKDIDFKYLNEAERELKEALGLYRKVNGSHTKTPGIKGEKQHRQNQFNNPQVAELNESINEAIRNLANGEKNERAWQRLAMKLEAWESDSQYGVIARKAKNAIKKFMKYIGKDSIKDAKRKYLIRYKNLDDGMIHVDVVKEDNVKAALRKIANDNVMSGTGTHYILIISIKREDENGGGATFQVIGRLDDLLTRNLKDSNSIEKIVNVVKSIKRNE